MKNEKGFVLSTYVYLLLVFFLLLLGTMLVVLNNTKLLSNKLKEGTQSASGLIDKDFSFVLLGNKDEIIRKDEEYKDKGFIAKTVKGVDLTEYVITKNNVDTSVIGNYEISYKVTYNGVTKELSRTVKVVDNVGVSYLNTLYQYRKDENGLIVDDTEDENLRYAGSNEDVKNYVEFGNTGELWRIIGVFDTQTEEGGVEVPRIKLVRDSWFTNIAGNRLAIAWDSSAEDVNDGTGVNQWGESTYEDGSVYEGADLMRLLNGYYIRKSGEVCKYCTAEKQINCESSCNNEIQQLSVQSINMIDTILWKIGTITYNQVLLLDTIYEEEQSDTIVKCTPGRLCTDKVNRNPRWIGKIGLIYPSDYAFASLNPFCKEDVYGNGDIGNVCGIDNWMYKQNLSYYTISPYYYGTVGSSVYRATADTSLNHTGVYGALGVRPSVYLSKDIKIIGGTGTENDPYKLSL